MKTKAINYKVLQVKKQRIELSKKVSVIDESYKTLSLSELKKLATNIKN